MSAVEKIVGTMFSLIFLYILVNNADAVNNFINHLGDAINKQVAALQGN